MAIQEAGLNVISVQNLIPYNVRLPTINGLKLAKDEIKEALKVVCESHNLALAQVWIAYEDKSHVLLSSPLEDPHMKRIMCNVIPRGIGSYGFPVLETLQDYGSRYIYVLQCNKLVTWDHKLYNLTSAFAICLRSNNTGNFNYAFEFVCTKQENYINYLEDIILTIKRCLPSYKFASGIELGDELDVIVAQSSTRSKNDKTGEAETFEIFRGKRSTPMPKPTEEGTKAKVGDYIAPSRAVRKTTPKVLPRIVIEEQFGKTMKEAANNLKVSLSTLKRRVKDLHIQEWPGPNYEKKKAKTLSIDQINTNKEDNGAIREPSAIKFDQNTLTIKAELGDDMIKFPIHILQATFSTLVEQIGNRFNCLGTFKLKYRDEAGDWILLRSDEELSYCIENLRKMETNEVRLRVFPVT
ncbi:protein NLP7-like [Bidens hawaiensis]|uniref:protein NLP7-like n=1 Tax=Bidens hawaiensis TaxID=980011 RepID=UPI004049FA2D